MAKDESVVARALCQLLEADMIAQGMDPKLARTLAGRACEVGVVRTGKAAKKGAKRAARTTRKAAKGLSEAMKEANDRLRTCLLYTSPSPRDKRQSRMPSSA